MMLEEQEQACQGESLPQNAHDRTMYSIVTESAQPSPFYQEPAELSPSICSAQSSDWKHSISATTLAKQWDIGVETVTRMLNATMKLAIHQAIHPIQ
jgi:hypothetical protein